MPPKLDLIHGFTGRRDFNPWRSRTFLAAGGGGGSRIDPLAIKELDMARQSREPLMVDMKGWKTANHVAEYSLEYNGIKGTAKLPEWQCPLRFFSENNDQANVIIKGSSGGTFEAEFTDLARSNIEELFKGEWTTRVIWKLAASQRARDPVEVSVKASYYDPQNILVYEVEYMGVTGRFRAETPEEERYRPRSNDTLLTLVRGVYEQGHGKEKIIYFEVMPLALSVSRNDFNKWVETAHSLGNDDASNYLALPKEDKHARNKLKAELIDRFELHRKEHPSLTVSPGTRAAVEAPRSGSPEPVAIEPNGKQGKARHLVLELCDKLLGAGPLQGLQDITKCAKYLMDNLPEARTAEILFALKHQRKNAETTIARVMNRINELNRYSGMQLTHEYKKLTEPRPAAAAPAQKDSLANAAPAKTVDLSPNVKESLEFIRPILRSKGVPAKLQEKFANPDGLLAEALEFSIHPLLKQFFRDKFNKIVSKAADYMIRTYSATGDADKAITVFCDDENWR